MLLCSHFNDAMKTLTVRGVPEVVHDALKRRAQLHRRSMNQQAIADLAEATQDRGSETDEMEKKKIRAERLIAQANKLREGMPRFLTAEQIDDGIREGRL